MPADEQHTAQSVREKEICDRRAAGKRLSLRVRDLALISLFAAFFALSAWISLPVGVLPVTLQTFAFAVCLLLLGGKRGSVALVLYLLLGAMGLPVFSGFSGGVGVLFGPTGGFLLALPLCGGLFWLLGGERKRIVGQSLVMGAVFLLLYLCGGLWFFFFYGEGITFLGALCVSVLPFLPFDLLKVVAAFLVASALKKQITV